MEIMVHSPGCRGGCKCHLCPVHFANNAITRPYSIIKKVKKLLVNVKITVSCKQMCLPGNFQQKWTLKHCCANWFSKTIIAILLKLLHICPSIPLFIPFIVLSSYFHVSLSLVAIPKHWINLINFNNLHTPLTPGTSAWWKLTMTQWSAVTI